MTTQPLAPHLLNLLVCPITRSPLTQDGDYLISEIGPLKYPIRNNIPVMIPTEAILPDGITTLEDFYQKFATQIPHA